jgi:hypothetical protein
MAMVMVTVVVIIIIIIIILIIGATLLLPPSNNNYHLGLEATVVPQLEMLELTPPRRASLQRRPQRLDGNVIAVIIIIIILVLEALEGGVIHPEVKRQLSQPGARTLGKRLTDGREAVLRYTTLITCDHRWGCLVFTRWCFITCAFVTCEILPRRSRRAPLAPAAPLAVHDQGKVSLSAGPPLRHDVMVLLLCLMMMMMMMVIMMMMKRRRRMTLPLVLRLIMMMIMTTVKPSDQ